jgi:hypothetical protein
MSYILLRASSAVTPIICEACAALTLAGHRADQQGQPDAEDRERDQ